MKKQDLIEKIDVEALYVALSTFHGTIQIFEDGGFVCSGAGYDPSRVAIIRGDGDYDRGDWGVSWDDDRGVFVVRDGRENEVGTADDSDAALEVAVSIFGLTAEAVDDLIENIEMDDEE